MEERTYHGPVTADGLADYLVGEFDQTYRTIAQKVGRGDHILVQIGHTSSSGRRVRSAVGVSITTTADGITVGLGQSNWIDLDDPGMAGLLIGAVFFPPLLIFPLLRGLRQYDMYQDLWAAVESYCARAGATQASTRPTHGIACPECGVVNHADYTFCTVCGTKLQRPPAIPSESADVVCPECHQTVTAGKFCSNCGTVLPSTNEQVSSTSA